MKIDYITAKFQRDFFQLYQKNQDLPSFTQIFYEKELVSEAFNFVERRQNRFLHSEIYCLHKAHRKLKRKYLSKCTLVTVLEPCLMCAGAIILSRIERVIYFVENQKEGGISSFSMENIQMKNHFPHLQFTENKEMLHLWSSFFKDKRL